MRRWTQSRTNDKSAIGVEQLGEYLVWDMLRACCGGIADLTSRLSLTTQRSQSSFDSHLVESEIGTSTFKLPQAMSETKFSQFPSCLNTGSAQKRVPPPPAIFSPSSTALPNEVDTQKAAPHRAQHKLREFAKNLNTSRARDPPQFQSEFKN